MSNLDEKLLILQKKKLTAKTIVEQQRTEIRLLKSSMTINERLEEIYKRFDNKTNLDMNLFSQVVQKSNETFVAQNQLHRTIDDLSSLIERILHILALPNGMHLKNEPLDLTLKKQKECFQLIKWKLSDIYANRIADEVSCITNKRHRLSFEDFQLPSGLLLGLYAMGFQNGPSDIQELILPYSFVKESRRNIIVQSKTGTGKTISYIIHALACIQSSPSLPQVLIIVPTTELAFTVGAGIEKMSAYLSNIQVTYVTSSFVSLELIHTPIVIGTIDVFDSFRTLIDFNQLSILIVDEIDTIIIREDYRQNLLDLLDNVPANEHCQILTYSSTPSEQIMNFTSELVPNAIIIKQKSSEQQLHNIEQFYVMCPDECRKIQLVNIILNQFRNTQIMIFCSDDHTTEEVYQNILSDQKHDVRMLTTKFTNHQRMSLIEEFRSHIYRIFILSAQTSATAHGIDLDHVNIVINYNLPCSLGKNSDLDYVTYHQRLDRCGRYDKHGYAFNLIQSLTDWNIQVGQESYFSFDIKPIDSEGIRSLVL
ncbi:unnamed protein product [Adineta ricciae]|uniref:RNA helicase n=1 Tax=Adineta ricciae TaxID=249248 RepID=A0A814TWL5_ADIRI|nr:unnamed protein product [Adineta ricciae]